MARRGGAWQLEGGEWWWLLPARYYSRLHLWLLPARYYLRLHLQCLCHTKAPNLKNSLIIGATSSRHSVIIFDLKPGIVSYGTQGCDSSLPGVYTRSDVIPVSNHHSLLNQITNTKSPGVIFCQLAQQYLVLSSWNVKLSSTNMNYTHWKGKKYKKTSTLWYC